MAVCGVGLACRWTLSRRHAVGPCGQSHDISRAPTERPCACHCVTGRRRELPLLDRTSCRLRDFQGFNVLGTA